MFDFLKKLKGSEADTGETKEETPEEPVSDSEASAAKEEKSLEDTESSGGGKNASSASMGAEIERIKASIDALGEIRKSFGERFNHISENIGELRQMILERDKSMQEIELKALKASDLVSTVQPEKIMIEIQKQEAKIEALNANLEGNESIMDKIMEELKEVKRKIKFFRGVEEIAKLSEETKKDLIELKKTESRININTDKVETIYVEMRKKFQSLDMLDSELKELKVMGEQNMKDIGALKDKTATLASKEDLDGLVQKVKRYIDMLKELEKKSSMTKDIDKLKNILDKLK
ncbi:hypothetical protein K9L16_01430 [Candidatus Pacearchaeota archaeon]|nr:hypothetical protein [Candidatus Pacearchaeota archaeon]